MEKSMELEKRSSQEEKESMDLIDKVGKERLRKFKELQKRSKHTPEEALAQIHFFDNQKGQKHER